MRGWDDEESKGSEVSMELLPQQGPTASHNLFTIPLKGSSPLGFPAITSMTNGHFNYQPLLENLRPIRRTEEIVRLRNDGGSIAVIETTDDPGRRIYGYKSALGSETE